MNNSITYGADPEFFFKDSRGVNVPTCGWLGGEKGGPARVPGCRDVGILEDGVAAELNVAPSTDPAHMVKTLHRAMPYVLAYANSKSRFGTLSTVSSCEALFSQASLLAAGEKARVFGCAPDFDAYKNGASADGISVNDLVRPNGELRLAGGHIHIGYKNKRPDIADESVMAMICDLYIGHPLICSANDKQGIRRRMYGSPGRYRPTAYGIEYRTPSNSWLFNPDAASVLIAGLYGIGALLDRPIEAIRATWNAVPWQELTQAIASEDSSTVFATA